MADAPTILTWDILLASGGARRPSLSDVGNATLIDDDPAPDKATMPYADQLNQWAKQLAAMGRILPSCGIAVTITAGVPSVAAAAGPGTAVSPGLFTVVDNGVGDTSITWAAGTFPTPILGASPTVIGFVKAFIGANLLTNGVQVKTFDNANAAIDTAFQVMIY